MLKNIFFDVGNTLLFPNHGRILAPLHAKGIVPTRDVLQDTERNTKQTYDRLVETTTQTTVSGGCFTRGLLEDSGPADDRVRDQLVDATRQSANWDKNSAGHSRRSRQYRLTLPHRVISNAGRQNPKTC
jgi:hypothetical protein